MGNVIIPEYWKDYYEKTLIEIEKDFNGKGGYTVLLINGHEYQTEYLSYFETLQAARQYAYDWWQEGIDYEWHPDPIWLVDYDQIEWLDFMEYN